MAASVRFIVVAISDTDAPVVFISLRRCSSARFHVVHFLSKDRHSHHTLRAFSGDKFPGLNRAIGEAPQRSICSTFHPLETREAAYIAPASVSCCYFSPWWLSSTQEPERRLTPTVLPWGGTVHFYTQEPCNGLRNED
jgi:hypothetical protein